MSGHVVWLPRPEVAEAPVAFRERFDAWKRDRNGVETVEVLQDVGRVEDPLQLSLHLLGGCSHTEQTGKRA